jgi:hypothetical protein
VTLVGPIAYFTRICSQRTTLYKADFDDQSL